MALQQANVRSGDDDGHFGAYRLNPDDVLHCPDEARVQLSARLACVLRELACRSGNAVSRLELIERCWPEAQIGEESLSRAIADLRKILRRHGDDCIETVYGLGYRLNTRQSVGGVTEKLAFCQEAWHRVYQRRIATLESAEELFTLVVKRDQEHVPAWVGLAETQFHRMQLGYSTTLEAAPDALAALDRALNLDPQSSAALAMKGLLLTWAEWDFDTAGALLEKARELDPTAYSPQQATGWHKLALGQFEPAQRHFADASRANPMSMTARAGVAFAEMFQGNDDAALHAAREMHRLDALGPVSQGLAAIFEAALGDSGKAVTMAEKSSKLLPESPASGAILAYALARQGRERKARKVLETTTPGGFRVGSNTLAALAWTELGEDRSAVAALESGFATRCSWLLSTLQDPRLAIDQREPFQQAVFG